MIKTVKATNYRGETLTIDLANPYSSGFAVTSIEGLGPNKATINTVEIATGDGAIYNSGRVDPRNIVIKMIFVGDDVENLRRKTYQYFPLNKLLTFEVVTDKRSAVISGYVESNEPQIFSKAESTSISIICPDPYFRSLSVENSRVVFYGEEPVFEFPFENEGNSPTIEFGIIHQITEANIPYSGESEVGAVFTIHALGPAKNVRIDNLDTGESMSVKIEMLSGDDLIISTVSGNKFVMLLRNGEYTNSLNRLDRNSDWFKLSKGDNAFAYQAEEGLNNLQFEVAYDTLYEGM